MHFHINTACQWGWCMMCPLWVKMWPKFCLFVIGVFYAIPCFGGLCCTKSSVISYPPPHHTPNYNPLICLITMGLFPATMASMFQGKWPCKNSQSMETGNWVYITVGFSLYNLSKIHMQESHLFIHEDRCLLWVLIRIAIKVVSRT